MVQDGTSTHRAVGLRFDGIAIPQGASITDASVQFAADEADAVATALTIRGEAANDAPAFTKVGFSLTARATTAASVAWSPPAWQRRGDRGAAQRTPNLSSIVQEMVARPGWASGNAIVLLITGSGERVAEPFEGGPPAVLTITYAS
jgi:hypothetical protein